jgi:predicted transposase
LEVTVAGWLGEDERLGEICRVFQSMNRTAYNRLIEGKTQREVERILLERFAVSNLLWRRNAIIQARGTIRSQRELLPSYVKELDWKIQRVKRRLNCARNALKRRGYQARISKLELKKARLEDHMKNASLPKVVFGGRRHVGSQEWRLKRRGQFLSVGDGWNKGNLNTRINRNPDGSFSL